MKPADENKYAALVTGGSRGIGRCISEMLSKYFAKRKMHTPEGRIGIPQDVANAAEFFISEKSNWIAGQSIIWAAGFHYKEFNF